MVFLAILDATAVIASSVIWFSAKKSGDGAPPPKQKDTREGVFFAVACAGKRYDDIVQFGQ